MKILSKYFRREFFKFFSFCLILFLTLFLVIDFVQKIDNFIEAEVTIDVVLSYFFYKIPFIILQMIPVAVMISVIVMFCLMKKNNEIMALQVSGLDILGVSKSVFIFTLFISILTFIISEAIVPYTSSRGNEIWNVEVEKQNPASFYGGGSIWYKSSNAIYWIKHFDGINKIMEHPSFYFFDDSFSLIKKIDARKGIWDDGVWKFEEGVLQERNQIGEYELNRFEDLDVKIPEAPEVFLRGEKNPEDMSFIQLRNFSEKISQEGYDDTKYIVDMNVKLAFPLVSLIMTVIGIPIALGLKKGSTPLAVALGVGVCFLYMVSLSFSRSLGLSGIFPPFFSAWAANIIFILLGLFLMFSLER
jgi:lipopolysaccharide export system permease protein